MALIREIDSRKDLFVKAKKCYGSDSQEVLSTTRAKEVTQGYKPNSACAL